MAEEARARYEKVVFKVVDLVILHDLYVYVCSVLPRASCLSFLRFVGRVQDDYAQEDEEYEEKLKKETVVLFFLAT